MRYPLLGTALLLLAVTPAKAAEVTELTTQQQKLGYTIGLQIGQGHGGRQRFGQRGGATGNQHQQSALRRHCRYPVEQHLPGAQRILIRHRMCRLNQGQP